MLTVKLKCISKPKVCIFMQALDFYNTFILVYIAGKEPLLAGKSSLRLSELLSATSWNRELTSQMNIFHYEIRSIIRYTKSIKKRIYLRVFTITIKLTFKKLIL